MNFRLATMALMTAVSALAATAAHAEETAPPPAVTVSGTVALVSDYRFRGVSQSNGGAAVQGGITVTHESGAYAGFWSSNLAGWGTFGGPNLELDLIAGYKVPVAKSVALDVGLTWYTYPGGSSKTAFVEPYVKVSGTLGSASVTTGVAYAPKQQALGKWYNSGASAVAGVYDNPGAKTDNFYIWTDAAAGIPSTPVTLKGHIGYSKGNSGLGPNGTSVAPTGEYVDWLLGADIALGKLTLGLAYVDTDISDAEAAYLQPNFSSTKNGKTIAGSKFVASITAAF
jgi:uncharacterized protein (TIGR02001 family)